jgi:hypothetical protein
VIVIGSGRCGSSTLAKILGSQPYSAVSHEHRARGCVKSFKWKLPQSVVGMYENVKHEVERFHRVYQEKLTKMKSSQRNCAGSILVGEVAFYLLQSLDPCFPKYCFRQGDSSCITLHETLERYYDDYYRLIANPNIQQRYGYLTTGTMKRQSC